MFLEGKWSCLPQLLGLVEPARLRSLMPLHKTTIRNEQVRYMQELANIYQGLLKAVMFVLFVHDTDRARAYP